MQVLQMACKTTTGGTALVQACMEEYIGMLQLLPYVNVYDRGVVQKACACIAKACRGNELVQATCKAVSSLFYTSVKADSVTNSLEMVGVCHNAFYQSRSRVHAC